MSADSAAVSGDSILRMRSFSVSTTTSASAAATIAPGGYEVLSTTDCDLKLGDNSVAATTLPSAQPASAVALVRLFAGVPRALTVDPSTTHYSTKAVAITGTVTFNGPCSHAQHPT